MVPQPVSGDVEGLAIVDSGGETACRRLEQHKLVVGV